jgi:8-oxo-dGTP pyrophosphatase MutT (NUDIX family)
VGLDGEWEITAERAAYADEWLDIRIADVVLPDGRVLAHRMIRTVPGAGVAAVDARRRVLLLWRHRFITRTWGWEVPMGRVEPGETAAGAAAREFEEETGWRAGPLRHLISVRPTPGISDSVHHLYQADTATRIGPPADGHEATRVEWVPLAEVPALVAAANITSGSTLAALLAILTAT